MKEKVKTDKINHYAEIGERTLLIDQHIVGRAIKNRDKYHFKANDEVFEKLKQKNIVDQKAYIIERD